MRGGNDELDRLRSERTELENHYIDELVSGRMDRRDFLRRGSMIGMSMPLLGAILAACGGSSSSSSTSTGSGAAPSSGKKGGTLRVAGVTPAAAVNPLTVADAGGLLMLNQTGEFLIFDSNLKLALQPMLALSWKPNADGSVWTFKLRPGVTFHNGKQMTADDVVYTFKQLSDPKVASNALSTFTGVLTPAASRRSTPRRSSSTSSRPTGTSPTWSRRTTTTRSSSPTERTSPSGRRRSWEPARSSWAATRRATGAIVRAEPQLLGDQGAVVRKPVQVLRRPTADDPGAAGRRRRRDRAVRPGGCDPAAEQLHLQDHQRSSPPTTASCRCETTRRRSTTRRSARPSRTRWTGPEWWRRCSVARAAVANDYPFGPRFPSTDTTVPQRSQNIDMAKQLLQQAGHSSINATLFTEQYQEIPQLAQAIQQNAKQAGININLKVETQTDVLRQGDVRQLRLARRADEPRRLRRPRRAERVPGVAADLQGPVERGPLQELAVRLAGQAVRGRARPPDPEDRSPARSSGCCFRRRRS